MIPIQLPAQFTGFSSRVDGGVSLRFVTRELNAEEIAELAKHRMDEGWLLFKGNEFKPEDVPKIDTDVGAKSQAQRQRAVIFKYWVSLGKEGEFETFYRNEVENNINSYKEKLNE